MRSTFIILINLIVGLYNYAYCEHEIELSFSDVSFINTRVIVSYWENVREMQLERDSIMHNKVSLFIPTHIRPGVLKISLNNGNILIAEANIIYFNENLNLTVELNQSMKVTIKGSGETPLYYNYFCEIDSFEKRIGKFTELFLRFQDDTDFINITTKYYSKEVTALSNCYKRISQESNNKVLVHLINASRRYFPNLI